MAKFNRKVRCMMCKTVASKDKKTDLYYLEYEHFCSSECGANFANRNINNNEMGVEYLMTKKEHVHNKEEWLLSNGKFNVKEDINGKTNY